MTPPDQTHPDPLGPHHWLFRAQGTPDEIRDRFHAHRRVYWHRTGDPGEEGAIHHLLGHALARLDPRQVYVVDLAETDDAPRVFEFTLHVYKVPSSSPEGSEHGRTE